MTKIKELFQRILIRLESLYLNLNLPYKVIIYIHAFFKNHPIEIYRNDDIVYYISYFFEKNNIGERLYGIYRLKTTKQHDFLMVIKSNMLSITKSKNVDTTVITSVVDNINMNNIFIKLYLWFIFKNRRPIKTELHNIMLYNNLVKKSEQKTILYNRLKKIKKLLNL
jgi:hypothetical protein